MLEEHDVTLDKKKKKTDDMINLSDCTKFYGLVQTLI